MSTSIGTGFPDNVLERDAEPTEAARAGDPPFPADLPIHMPTLERLAIGQALRLERGNRTRAARRLGISLRTLRNKLRLYRAAASATTLARPSQLPSFRRAA